MRTGVDREPHWVVVFEFDNQLEVVDLFLSNHQMWFLSIAMPAYSDMRRSTDVLISILSFNTDQNLIIVKNAFTESQYGQIDQLILLFFEDKLNFSFRN